MAGVAVAGVAVAGDRLGRLHRAPRAAVVSGCHTRTGDGAMWCGLNLLPRIHMLPSSDRDLYGDGGSGGPEPAPGGRGAGGRQAQVQALGPRASDCCPPRPRDHAFPSLTPAAGGIWFRRPEDTNTPPAVPELREAQAGEQTEAPAKGRAQPPRRRAPPARPPGSRPESCSNIALPGENKYPRFKYIYQ